MVIRFFRTSTLKGFPIFAVSIFVPQNGVMPSALHHSFSIMLLISKESFFHFSAPAVMVWAVFL